MPITETIAAAGLGLNGLSSFANFGSSLFGMNQSQRNFDRQMEFAKYQYEDQKRYNSAVEQVKRLRAAGINPALAFGSNAGMAQAVSQPSAPQLHAPQFQPLDLNGLAATLHGMELNVPERERTKADTAKTRADTVTSEFTNKMNALFGEKMKDQELQSKVADTKLALAQAFLAAERGETETTVRQLNKAMEFANYAKGGYDDALRREVEIQLETYRDYCRALLRESLARGQYYRAGAGLSSAQTIGQILNNGLFADTYPEQVEGKKNEMRNIGTQGRLLNATADEAESKADIARVRGEHAEELFWLEFGERTLNAVGGVADAFLSWKKLPAYNSLSESAKKRVDAEVNQMRFEQNWRTEQRDYDRSTYTGTESYSYRGSNGKIHNVTKTGRFAKSR